MPIKPMKSIRKNSIKKAMDHLPDGIAFFSGDDLLILSNHAMNELVQKLTGRDLQLLSELRSSVAGPDERRAEVLGDFGDALRFADGNVWRFVFSEITDRSGRPVTQIAAYNMNEQYGLYEELQRRNRELLEMQERLNAVLLRVADNVREQEILAAKMNVHNKMGSCMLLLRHYLRGEHDRAEKEQLLEAFRTMTGELKQEIGQADDISALDDIVNIAEGLGLKIRFEGGVCDDPAVAAFLAMALRECVTNTLRHAGGTVLTVTLTREEGLWTAEFRDNGKPPAAGIVPGGGLSNLRERLEKAGVTMEVRALPKFVLTLRIPAGMSRF